MKTFDIALNFEVAAWVTVEAETIGEAYEMAKSTILVNKIKMNSDSIKGLSIVSDVDIQYEETQFHNNLEFIEGVRVECFTIFGDHIGTGTYIGPYNDNDDLLFIKDDNGKFFTGERQYCHLI